MKRMADDSPKEINYEAISRAFGSPKPTLANSYEPELLNLRTFPTSDGLFQPHHGGELGIEHALLGGAGR